MLVATLLGYTRPEPLPPFVPANTQDGVCLAPTSSCSWPRHETCIQLRKKNWLHRVLRLSTARRSRLTHSRTTARLNILAMSGLLCSTSASWRKDRSRGLAHPPTPRLEMTIVDGFCQVWSPSCTNCPRLAKKLQRMRRTFHASGFSRRGPTAWAGLPYRHVVHRHDQI